MLDLKCQSCGAPLSIEASDFAQGFVKCEFCGSAFKLGDGGEAALDENVKKGLAMLSRFKNLIAPEDLTDLNKPAEKPYDSKVRIENMPGYRFHARIPAAGFNIGSVFFGGFTFIWCGFMAVWNTIAITEGEWIMLAFGTLHDLVGVGLMIAFLWSIAGTEDLIFEGQQFKRQRRILGIGKTTTYPAHLVSGVIFRRNKSNNNAPNSAIGLFAVIGGKKVRIASNTTLDEARYIRTELLRYLNLPT
ncbi:MAG: hypothetical protein H6684_00605 [Deltaproteobacteria bacterium]|nr:hypothetical protein [Deltaproteobacteria bacterium]